MKNVFNVLTAILLISLLSSCSSTQSSIPEQQVQIAEIEREDYVLLDRVEKTEKTTRVWVLFIPFGGKKESKLKNIVYNEAVKSVPTADGLIKPRYEYKKTTIPLILFTITIKRMTVSAKAYRLKNDEELKQ